MEQTVAEYKEVIEYCRRLFAKKMSDYGTAWRVLRPSSLTDQIYIKAQRIRNIQMADKQMVQEDSRGEFVAIVNYSIMALIQLELKDNENWVLPDKKVLEKYDTYSQAALNLMKSKNHDYAEAWRNMRVESLTDIIMMKILRTKQIEDHHGKTLVSEGLDANYYDMLVYAVFSLIKTGLPKSL